MRQLADQIREQAREMGFPWVGESVVNIDECGVHAQLNFGRGKVSVYKPATEEGDVGVREDYVIEVWQDGYYSIHGIMSNLKQVIDFAVAWESRITLSEATHRWPSLRYDRLAAAHEQGNAVDVQWSVLLDDPDTDQMDDLLNLASRRPRLRMLFPWVGQLGSRLGFSLCTGYPFTDDIPVIDVTRDGFRLTDVSVGVVVGDFTDASEALDRVVESIPGWAGPAVPGTVDDIDRPPEP